MPRKILNEDMLSNKTQVTSSTTSEEGIPLPIKDKEVDELSLVEKSTITVERIIKDYKLKWGKIDKRGLQRFLCKEHDFDQKRIRSVLSKI